MAPEINKTSCHHINEKVDVYSFGIVVLEIISGREREDFCQRFRPEEKHLCDWVCVVLHNPHFLKSEL
jgi:serine/threonine protein kinase